MLKWSRATAVQGMLQGVFIVPPRTQPAPSLPAATVARAGCSEVGSAPVQRAMAPAASRSAGQEEGERPPGAAEPVTAMTVRDSRCPGTDECPVHGDTTESAGLPPQPAAPWNCWLQSTCLLAGEELPVMVSLIICTRAAAHRITHRPDCSGERSKKPRQAVKIALDMQTLSLPVTAAAPCSGATPRTELRPGVSLDVRGPRAGREERGLITEMLPQPLCEGSAEREARSKATCMYTSNLTPGYLK